MCTVTVVPTHGGFRLVCNRDERRDRRTALAPGIHEAGALESIFPIDPEGGGTWIGVNTAGLAAALLNGGRPQKNTGSIEFGPDRRFSRGLIIPSVLHSTSVRDALRVARRVKASSFHPFRLVLVQDTRCAVVSSDGQALSVQLAALDRPLIFTSSSLGEDCVAVARRTLFEQHVLAADGIGRRVEGQRRFHLHSWPARPEISVVMARPDARTVSRTAIEVCDMFVTLEYEPLDGAAARVIAVGRAA